MMTWWRSVCSHTLAERHDNYQMGQVPRFQFAPLSLLQHLLYYQRSNFLPPRYTWFNPLDVVACQLSIERVEQSNWDYLSAIQFDIWCCQLENTFNTILQHAWTNAIAKAKQGTVRPTVSVYFVQVIYTTNSNFFWFPLFCHLFQVQLDLMFKKDHKIINNGVPFEQ